MEIYEDHPPFNVTLNSIFHFNDALNHFNDKPAYFHKPNCSRDSNFNNYYLECEYTNNVYNSRAINGNVRISLLDSNLDSLHLYKGLHWVGFKIVD